MAERNLYSIPNILSLTRLALVPVLIALAYLRRAGGISGDSRRLSAE